jgi:uncharacterized protein (TIGR02118 family)
MYKLYAFWSAPKPQDQPAFEKHYNEIHAPLARAVPEIRRLVTVLTPTGLEGGPPATYRVAEMIFDDAASLERSAHSPEWKSLREDSGVLLGRFGNTLTVSMGDDADPAGAFDLATTDRLLATTRAVRKRLDLAKPVPRDVILDCLRLSQQAPTGSNRQGWRWVVVSDEAKRAKLADIYRRGGASYLEDALKATPAGDAQTRRVYESALWLVENLAKVPVHVIPCIAGRLPEGGVPAGMRAGFYGSIFPAVWSFQLALRSRGLGSVLTTLHANLEQEAADLLGIPYKDFTQVALLPIGYTKGMDFKPAARPPIESIVSFDRWS